MERVTALPRETWLVIAWAAKVKVGWEPERDLVQVEEDMYGFDPWLEEFAINNGWGATWLWWLQTQFG